MAKQSLKIVTEDALLDKIYPVGSIYMSFLGQIQGPCLAEHENADKVDFYMEVQMMEVHPIEQIIAQLQEQTLTLEVEHLVEQL